MIKVKETELSNHPLVLQLVEDLEKLGLPLDFTLVVDVKYSKRLYGVYDAKDSTIHLFVYTDPSLTEWYDYNHIFTTLLHEVCHYLIFNSPNYVRSRIHHTHNFWCKFEGLTEQAKSLFSDYEVPERVKGQLSTKSLNHQKVRRIDYEV